MSTTTVSSGVGGSGSGSGITGSSTQAANERDIKSIDVKKKVLFISLIWINLANHASIVNNNDKTHQKIIQKYTT